MTEPTDAELAALIDKEMREYSDGAYADHGSAKNQFEHFARAIEAEVRARDEALIRQLVDALCMPCDRWNGTQSRIVRGISAGFWRGCR